MLFYFIAFLVFLLVQFYLMRKFLETSVYGSVSALDTLKEVNVHLLKELREAGRETVEVMQHAAHWRRVDAEPDPDDISAEYQGSGAVDENNGAVTFSPFMQARIDTARKDQSRAAYIEQALEAFFVGSDPTKRFYMSDSYLAQIDEVRGPLERTTFIREAIAAHIEKSKGGAS